jgi:hypothetical protein
LAPQANVRLRVSANTATVHSRTMDSLRKRVEARIRERRCHCWTFEDSSISEFL